MPHRPMNRRVDRNERGTGTLQSDMLAWFKKAIYFAPHGKPVFMKHARKILAIISFVALASCVCGQAGPTPAGDKRVWVATWGASQQIPEPQNSLPADDLRDATVRQSEEHTSELQSL